MHPTRRQCLAGAVAGAACAAIPDAAAAGRMPFFARHRLPLGLQIYTLAEKAVADLPGTLKAVKAIGYRTIELAGFYGRTPRQLRAAIDAAGLTCPSAHIAADARAGEPALSGDIPGLAAAAHALGVRGVVMPVFRFPERIGAKAADESFLSYLQRAGAAMTPDDWKANADFLNRVGAVLQREGLKLGYHNHNPEFAPIGKTTGFELLMRHTDPALVQFEMDAGWVAAAGLDPIALLERYPGRFRQMHVKDIRRSTVTNYAFRQDPTEVGQGKIDWAHILPRAYAAGIRDFFVEQEPPFPGDRLDSVAASRGYLATLIA